jgi:hypothetical protein
MRRDVDDYAIRTSSFNVIQIHFTRDNESSDDSLEQTYVNLSATVNSIPFQELLFVTHC